MCVGFLLSQRTYLLSLSDRCHESSDILDEPFDNTALTLKSEADFGGKARRKETIRNKM
jgi:hypothetical protein